VTRENETDGSEAETTGAGPDGGAGSPGAQRTLVAPSPAAVRDELLDLVLKDLHGPAGGAEEEVNEDRVSERYLVGMLAPRNRLVPVEEDDELAVGEDDFGEDGTAEPTAAPATTLFPSSMGLTFTVAPGVSTIRVTASWGRYEKRSSETARNPKTGAPARVWKRVPVARTATFDLARAVEESGGRLLPWAPCDEQPDVVVRGIVRRPASSGSDPTGFTVTLFLVNDQTEPKQLRDAVWLFQPELIVEGEFVGRRLLRDHPGDGSAAFEEEAELAMLYRRHPEFAVGHGAAVHADTVAGDPWRAVRLATRYVPSFDVAQVAAPTADEPGFERLAGLVLDMKQLAGTPREQLAAALTPLVEAYGGWIEDEERRLADPAERLADHAVAGRRNVERCKRTLERIRAGIDLIARDEVAAEAFCFANRAMWLQRIRSLFAEEKRRGGTPDLARIDGKPANRSWRPFQLAFILLNLPSVTDLHHPDRSEGDEAIADLLWFPTGGGKTEAYLGLTAYVLAIRRLQGPVEGRSAEAGVAVLMRYTLRLLTLQQFQRASALICACETIRREEIAKGNMRLGTTPFRIGLWVGYRATPNSTDDAVSAIEKARGFYSARGSFGGSGSPHQLTNCPWCGSRIDPGRNIRVEAGKAGDRRRTLTFCGDVLGLCPFSEKQAPDEGLPVLVVDEEIYRLLPALLIATVDKFAQMPWNGRTQMLFGRVNQFCPRHGFRSPEIDDADSHPRSGSLPAVSSIPHGPLRPPDLIIQDELHLISGPLGTLVGLYETAVDELSSWEVGGRRVRPKVVASTATVRNAAAQVRALFLRRVEIFPPPGTDVGCNFFSLRRDPSEANPGRRYVGICASGRRLKAALIRVNVAFLAAAQTLYERYDRAADPWMTLVGYFNSMRELGGTRRLVEDDIRNRLRNVDARGLATRRPPILEELTSRKSSTDIPEVLDRLEIGFDLAGEARRKAARQQGRPADGPEPLDVLLATNMVSVGVDVKRLGLMVVCGQPKTTAEYIQATSRVGRTFPGLVCTIYNWARPRDLSHFERFESYHATFYEQVEALSLTPFAARALDRGLTALLVSLVRLQSETFNENRRAGAVTGDHPNVARALAAIAARAERILGSPQMARRVRAMLDGRLEQWLARADATGGFQLTYREQKDGVSVPLLERAGQSPWGLFTCPSSLREVEAQVGLILVDDGLSRPEGTAGAAASGESGDEPTEPAEPTGGALS